MTAMRQQIVLVILTLLLAFYGRNARGTVAPGGMLYPRESETRDTSSLNGIWNFRLAPTTDHRLGFDQFWYKRPLAESGDVILMPVPSSFNDITQNIKIRDHVGLVWYDRKFFVSDTWRVSEKRVWLRFSAITYAAQIWINGEFVMNHDIGHLPFQHDITSYVRFGKENLLTVACDNMLRADTVPQGIVNEVNTDNGKKLVLSYSFDFFHYAGIHRPVTLYTTPNIYIDDITIETDIDGDTGFVFYEIVVGGEYNYTDEQVTSRVVLLDRAGNPVAKNDAESAQFLNGTLTVPLARFWWPYLMDPDPGYLYTLEVILSSQYEDVLDVYRLPIGIRTLKWNNSSLLINERPVYLHGFGRHEDSDIRGKGLDLPLIVKDYNLIQWVGANAYRTSHYPYADEIMDMADRMGIMIIDECPSVDTDIFSNALLEKHKDSLTELIRRDKNRPSVIAWSLSNEPATEKPAADAYFGAIVQHVKSLDISRPVTIALSRQYTNDNAAKYLDIISFNRYNGWYSNAGQLDMITQRVINEAEGWHNRFNKPVLMSEYGADTYEGLHIYPEYVWSEDYQVELMSRHFKAFDTLRKRGWFIGEFIWNFADFKTDQTTTRVGGNKKGIFTRNRQPKSSAHHLRRRYLQLAHQLYNVALPEGLYPYDAPHTATYFLNRTEL